jgi:hypothetical protein
MNKGVALSKLKKSVVAIFALLLAVGTPAFVATSASAENSCNGQARVSFDKDYASVRGWGCGSLAVKHKYFAGGQWFWSPVVYKYSPSAGVGYPTAVKSQLNYAEACAAVLYPQWNCSYGSWEGPITTESFTGF